MKRVYLPFRADFGNTCRYHAKQVHADPLPKIVACEPGMESLYPTAERLIEVPRRENYDDRTQHRDVDYEQEFRRHMSVQEMTSGGEPVEFITLDYDAPRAEFKPEPLVEYDITCDVIVVPRFRAGPKGRNFPYWCEVTRRLVKAGLRVFAAGCEDASEDVGVESAWHYERNVEASLCAMRSAKTVVSVSCGFVELAMMVGCPVHMILGPNGRVANKGGEKFLQNSLENPHGVRVVPMRDTWRNPDEVAEAVVSGCA